MRRELLGLLVEILSEELMQLVVVVTRGHVEPIVPIRSIVSSVNGAAFIMMMARMQPIVDAAPNGGDDRHADGD